MIAGVMSINIPFREIPLIYGGKAEIPELDRRVLGQENRVQYIRNWQAE